MNRDTIKKISILIGLALAFWGLYRFTPLHDYLTLAYMQQQSSYFKEVVSQNYWLSVAIYIVVFVLTIALSLPSSILLTLLGGYLFGAIYGALFATISVTIGVLIAYLFFRLFLQDMLHKMYKVQAEQFERAVQTDGVSYLLMLHFSAVLPYFAINAFAALAQVPVLTVVWTTIVGFLPQGIIYAFAGKGFGELAHLNDIFSFEIVITFVLLMLLAFLPIIIRRYKKQ